MNEQEKHNREEQILRVDKMLADMKLNAENTIADIEHNLEQKNHWKVQRFIWACGVIVAISALVLNAYIKTQG